MNKMATEPMSGTEAAEGPRKKRKIKLPQRKNALRGFLMWIVPALLLIGGGYYWLTSGDSVSTDDAFVKQDIVSVSAQVNGPIAQVLVKNGDQVKRGDVLFRIDPQPYQVALEQAQAQLAAAKLQTTQLQTQAAGTGADIVGEQANLQIKKNALARQQALLKQGFTTRADYEDALNEVKTAEQDVADAKARAANAHAALAPGEQPQIAQAKAAVDKARLDLERTTVRAPMDGVVENADNLQVGQMAVTGLGMLSLVHSKTAWVEANFKEKDVGRMVPGQRAKIEVDAYPDQEFAAHVESVGAGTGSEFSLLPAQNANGNWVKVTQRVPVRIAFDGTPSKPMIAGLSVNATVFFDKSSKK
jgi:membrane fusion protein (multidrug efflux system)